MSSLETQMPMITRIDVIQSVWDKIRSQLESEKVRIYEALGNYPPPIAACDQQFNYLLEKRTEISRELDRLNEAAIASLTIEDSLKRINEFIRSSNYFDSEAGQITISSLKEGFPNSNALKL